MSDLDQQLADAFTRRTATVAGSVLAPEAVHRAVRRQRAQTARYGLAGIVVAAIAFVGVTDQLGSSAPTSPPTGQGPTNPVPVPRADPALVASLPWSPGVPLELRTAPAGGFLTCVGAVSCGELPPPGGHGISLSPDNGALYGLAPVGTTTVTVEVSGRAVAQVPTAPTPPAFTKAGVLFGDPDIALQESAGSAFTHTYTISAYDGQHGLLARISAVGGADLAVQHPPAGTVLSLSSDGAADPTVVAWGDEKGWACWGERAAGPRADYAAYACIPPTQSGEIAMVGQDSAHGALVLRVPDTMAKVELRNSHGVISDSPVTDVGHTRLAYLDSWPASDATVIGLDARGHQVTAVPSGSLLQLAGTVTSPGSYD